MLVKQLIAELQKLNPEAHCFVSGFETSCFGAQFGAPVDVVAPCVATLIVDEIKRGNPIYGTHEIAAPNGGSDTQANAVWLGWSNDYRYSIEPVPTATIEPHRTVEQEMANTMPTLDQIKAINGKVLAMLTDDERKVLAFYRDQGRKFDVQVSFVGDVDDAALDKFGSLARDEILRRSNTTVHVTVGVDAPASWKDRAN